MSLVRDASAQATLGFELMRRGRERRRPGGWRWLVGLSLAGLISSCADRPVLRVHLPAVDDFTLLQQMVWLDRPADKDDFGAGGRAAYVEAVRAEILARHPQWPTTTREAIRAGRVELEMTKAQVVTSIGWPNEYPALLWAEAPPTRGPLVDDLAVSVRRGRANTWSYGHAPRNLFVNFDPDRRAWRIIDNRSGETIVRVRDEAAR
ncbi:MAG: hypothetical protein ACYTGG_05440 [Planctomycetota bacterium]